MRVEWLMIADSAQVVGNKLYVLGGGWDMLTVRQAFPVTQHLALAISFSVPWNETNMKHNFEIELVHDDGKSLAKIGGQIEVGRPPGVPAGSEQRSQFALDMNLTFPSPGVYVVTPRIEGKPEPSIRFRVVGGQPVNIPGI